MLADIGIERLSTGDGEEHAAEHDEAAPAVMGQEG